MIKNIFKDIRRQVYAKKSTVGSTIIAMLIVAAAISTFLIIIPEKVEAASYGDFGSYKELTIESDYIDTGLSNFPILVHDNTGDLSDILANGSDIAFFNSAKDTQYNHEIEFYNSTSGELWAWVNVTTVSDGADTVFYMYYDDSDGGYTIGHNPTNTWDSDYVTIQHFNDSLTDSTSNGYDSIFDNTSDIVGIAGRGRDFVASQFQIVEFPDFWNLSTTDFTIEIWCKPDILSNPDHATIINKYESADDRFSFHAFEDNGLTFVMGKENGGLDDYYVNNTYDWDVDTWYYLVTSSVRNVNGNLYVNKIKLTSDTETTSNTDYATADHIYLGVEHSPDNKRPYDGTMDEFRISTICRNTSWLNATYESINETTGFLTLGSQEGEEASSFSIKGLTSGRITFAGTAGTTVWCNSSGDGNEWPEINMTVNATDNVTEFRVFMDDLNDTSAWINASNITMYVSSDNSSYGEMGTFTDGGSNCSKAINATNWNAGTMGTDPFAGAGLTNTNTSIYLTFKLAIPTGSPTDEFYSAASDSLKIYIGVE